MKIIYSLIFCLGAYAHAQANNALSNLSGVDINADLIFHNSGSNATHYVETQSGDNLAVQATSDSMGFGGGVNLSGESIIVTSGQLGGFLLQTPSGSYNDIDINPDYDLVVGAGEAGSNFVSGKPIQLQPGNAQPSCDSSQQGTLYYVAGATGVADQLQICMKAADDSFSWHSVP